MGRGFEIGITGTGLLAIPVMAGASAYALSDTFGWNKIVQTNRIKQEIQTRHFT
jgi:hypothetical protein